MIIQAELVYMILFLNLIFVLFLIAHHFHHHNFTEIFFLTKFSKELIEPKHVSFMLKKGLKGFKVSHTELFNWV